MSLGFGHLIGAWLPAKAVEYYKKAEFTPLVWGLLLFGSILPDADFLLEWLNIMKNVHRTFTHSLLFVIFVGVVTYVLAKYFKQWLKTENPKHLAYAIALGVASHIIYDVIFYPGVNLLYPFNWWFAEGSFYFATQTLYERLGGTLQDLNKTNLFIVDMGMGAAWFFYFLIRGRLKP